ncbi:MAG: glycosyltransferase family 1 protein [Patescibacteria group bacterium]|jgi:glycosyltransferase involved in cell wall biosynthesis
MVIAIDASKVAKERMTGTEYYSLQVILGLARIDHENQYILYSPRPIYNKLGQLPSNFTVKVIPFPKLWSQIRLSFEIMKRPKIDVWFFPAHTIPIIAPKNSVVTLHDLGFKYYPELYTPFERFYHNWCMNFSAKWAKKIIAISNFTKSDLIKNYPKIDANKISVIYHGYDKNLYRKLKPGEQETPPIAEKYFFFIGRIEKKKNIVNLIEAFKLLSKEKDFNHKLVLAGSLGYGYDEIKEKIDNLPLKVKESIVELGYVKLEEVPRWLRNAEAFVFPSNFEGFGMPIIEAMACGTPVIASNTTSIPEVAANAAILINPQKPFELTAAMSKIIHNSRERYKYINLGKERAEEFDWDKCAHETLEVIKSTTKK